MNVTRQTINRQLTEQHELLHWLLVIATAIALTLLVARALSAADPMPEPRLLPNDMGQFARPMTPEIVKPFFPESPPARQLPHAEAAARLQEIIDHHRVGETLKAINEWANVGLPQETAHWREIAMGAGYLHLGDLDRAALRLEAAQQLMPGHPVAAYFTGLLRLEQAAAADRVPERRQRGDLLVSYSPMEDRALYRLLAIGELEMAIQRAREIRLDEPLVGIDPLVEQDLIVPTAGDLITALGAENFVGKAHHVLFGLRLDQSELAIAERHLDRAAATGITVLHGYRDLAEGYLLVGENREAIRLGRKDMDVNQPELARFVKWLMGAEQPGESWVW
jgi:tetratricopeptide (TPR) repeat protein